MTTHCDRNRVRTDQRGFSMAELSVALGIVSILFIAALSLLSLDQRIYARQDQTLEAVREGRHALTSMERDLLMLGFQVDTQTVADLGPDGTINTADDIVGQAQIVFAGPFDFTFNADVSPTAEAIADGASGDSVPVGYAPVTFYTGAETVRYTLDSNDDGTVNASDRGDQPEESVVSNAGLYLLNREVYASSGGTNSFDKGEVALIRGPVAYPSGARSVPLFQYWGYFDADPALDLWGDNGSGGGTTGNGILEPGEITALTAVTDEDADNDATIDTGEDRNADGVLQRRITDLIRKVEVHVTTETTVTEPDYYDPVRSSAGNKFRYRVSTLSTQIKPRNIDLPGGSCRDNPEPVGSVAIANACPDALADGVIDLNWTLSSDDGGGEQDVAKYILFRTDQDNLFSTTPYDEVEAGVGTWQDNQINMRSWPPVQYWYKTRSMDCTPALSASDPVAGPYPADVGAHYAAGLRVTDVPGDAGDQLDIQLDRSPDEGSNTSGFGGTVDEYHVYRSTSEDYRCVPPVNSAAINASGSAMYVYRDNATNSTSAPTLGQLYYYWNRTVDDQGAISPYSARYCGRAYEGPTFPLTVRARVVDWAANNHPVEIYFARNQANEDAGYPRESVAYRIYRSRDIDADGTLDSLVDDSVGYTSSDLVGTAYYKGLIWVVGDNGSSDVRHSIEAGGYTGWHDAGEISPSNFNAIAFGSRLDGVAVGDAGEVQFTSDGGIYWYSTGSGVATQLNDVAFLGQRDVIAVGAAGTIIRSTDAGQSWTTINAGIGDDLNSVATVGDRYVFISGDSGAALRSDDGGLNFTPMVFTSDTMAGICAVAEGGGSITVWAGGDDELWKSLDGGDSWTAISAGAGKMKIACAPAGRVVAISDASDKAYTTNDGASFATAPIFPNNPTDVAFLDEFVAFVIDENGVLYRWNSNDAWSTSTVDSMMQLRGMALRPEIAWEDSSTATAPAGQPFHYVVTSYYNDGTALSGECGMLPDRSSTVESPDDNLDQILVDSCNDFEVSVVMP